MKKSIFEIMDSMPAIRWYMSGHTDTHPIITIDIHDITRSIPIENIEVKINNKKYEFKETQK